MIIIVRCLGCGEMRACPLEQPSGVPTEPAADDFWLCSQCGALHRFTGTVLIALPLGRHPVQANVRRAGLEELCDLDEASRDLLLAKRQAIRGGSC